MKNRILDILIWTALPIGITCYLLEHANYSPVAVIIAIVVINFVGFIEGLTKRNEQ